MKNESMLLMMSKRQDGVTKNIHDRFLIVDDDVYHIGASLKDLGKKLFAFSKMSIPKSLFL